MTQPEKPLTRFEAQKALEELWAKQMGERIRRYTCIALIIVCVVLLLSIAIIPALIILPCVLALVVIRKGLKGNRCGKSNAVNQQPETNLEPALEESDVKYSISNESTRPAMFKLSKQKANQPWLLALSKDFLKRVAKIDRNLQGRILDAISEIVDQPVSPSGDTKTPLTGDKSGMWRYRVGGYRIIYRPDINTHIVEIITFVERGTAYRTGTA